MLLFLVITVAVQVAYHLFIFSRLADYDFDGYRATPDQVVGQPVSVIICARDERNSLNKNLTAVLEQKYPSYEVIVVNDNSGDDTELLLMDMQARFPHLVVRNIQHSTQKARGKKYPLMIGIRAASHDCILLTDADCVPSSDHWIRDMVQLLDREKEIVIGYAPFTKHPGFLNKFIRFECFISALNYFSFALAGWPYMGVGRNLAYRKQVFFDHNIYAQFPHLVSGDDDLLINQAAKKKSVAIQISRSTFMYSEPKATWDEYLDQKRRHVTTSKYYKWHHKILLVVLALSSTLFYVFLLLNLLYTSLFLETIFLYLLKMLIQCMVLNRTMKKLEERDLFLLVPIFDLLIVLFYIKLIPAVFQSQPHKWK